MGRYSNAKRAELAAKAAETATKAVQVIEPAKVETVEPQPESTRSAPETVYRNPRDGMMEEVIARHNKGFEPQEPEAAQEPQEEPKAEAPKAETPKEEPKPEVAPEPVAEPVVEQPKNVRVKVDGEEFDVPEAEVNDAGGLRAYQLQRAADNRLKKAQEVLAGARKSQSESAPPPAPQIGDDEFLVSRVDAMLFGETPAVRAAALREVLQRSNPKTDNSIVINQAVTQIKRDNAITKFREEFSDVASNPLLMKLAGTLENETLSKIPPDALANPQFVVQFDWNDFYRRIGNQVRGAVGRPSQPAQPSQTNGTPSPSPDKEARKASIVNLPTAAARAAIPEEAKPETRADILNDMRKSRGLPTE